MIDNVIKGLQILQSYGADCVCAEHDEIWSGHNTQVSNEDKLRLDELGWFYDEDIDGWVRYV